MAFGMTQFAYLNEDLELDYNNFQSYVYNAGFTYRINAIDTDISAEYGKYLEFDIGYQVSVQRQFNEVYIGFFFKKTNAGENLGFNFQVPILGNKYLKPNRVRIRPGDQFMLNYGYSGTNDVGSTCNTGENFQNNLKEFYPQVLKKSLKKILNQ